MGVSSKKLVVLVNRHIVEFFYIGAGRILDASLQNYSHGALDDMQCGFSFSTIIISISKMT